VSELLLAEAGIRQLHARYVDAVWRKDLAAFVDCFAQDAEWKIAGMHLRGRLEIEGAIARLLGACERVLMTVGTPVLEIRHGSAIGRLYCLEYARLVGAAPVMNIGIYYDRYLKEGGRWLFQWRHWSLQYRGPPDLSAPFVDSPDYGPFPNMPPSDAPTIVRKA